MITARELAAMSLILWQQFLWESNDAGPKLPYGAALLLNFDELACPCCTMVRGAWEFATHAIGVRALGVKGESPEG